jgi:hypothetical protein
VAGHSQPAGPVIRRPALLPVLLLLAAAWAVAPASALGGAERLVVEGIGYPPVKVRNKAQALAMARRAAVLDACRRALTALRQQSDPESEKGFYQNVAGFVRGMELIEETYLADGGLRIRASFDRRDVHLDSVSTKVEMAPLVIKRGAPAELRHVTREQWYDVIKPMVRIESEESAKGVR